MKYLVIVESPAKKKPIEKYLGKNYEVKASFGHIRDLPSKNGSVLPEENFSMKYVISDKSGKHVEELVKSAKKAEIIYLATDPDREGESIAWHVAEVLREKKLVKSNQFLQRITFNEITKKAVTEALASPRQLDLNLINAQQARRALDYLVGFTLSPVLWRKLPGCRSAGRVQSVALRLICEREAEIETFKSQEYWDIILDSLNSKNQTFSCHLTHAYNKKLEKFSLTNQEDTTKIVNILKTKQFIVQNIKKSQQKRLPPPPFITSTIQQEAARKLGFSAKKTMTVAQKLYEGIDYNGEVTGLITYMRTDGVTLSQDAMTAIRSMIEDKFGKDYLPNSQRVYKSKVKNAQEAHEAIRPTNIDILPENLKGKIEDDYYKLYDLIWKRAIASQMENVIIDKVAADIISDDQQFIARANGSTIYFDGFYKIYQEGLDDNKDEDNDNLLPPLSIGEEVNIKKIIPQQHFTEPPPRYSEASLVKALEEEGIGRPSTYASIISVLQDREYVNLTKKRFVPEERGRFVTSFLVGFFKQYVEYDFTARLEDQLDEVAEGKLEWKALLEQFWQGFNNNIKEVNSQKIGDVINYIEKSLDHHLFQQNDDNRICPSCNNGKLALKLGKFGAFLGCSNYPDCNFKRTLSNNSTIGTENVINLNDNDKLLGQDNNGINIYLKKGPYGWYLQLGEVIPDDKKPKRTPLPPTFNPATIDLASAIKLVNLPLTIGVHPEDKNEITVGIGKFGPYIKYDKKFISIPKAMDPFSISLNTALELITKNQEKPAKSKKK